MLTSTVPGVVPPLSVMVKALFARPVATVPRGSGVGSRMVQGTAQPEGLAASPQRAAETPQAKKLAPANVKPPEPPPPTARKTR